MLQIVNAHVAETGARPDAPPRVLKAGETNARLPASNDPRIVRIAGQGGENLRLRLRWRHHPRTRLAVRGDFVIDDYDALVATCLARSNGRAIPTNP